MLERAECVVHGDEALGDSRLHEMVSTVTRSADGEEQFVRAYCARINRDAGQPGQGVEARGKRDAQRASHLFKRPPHDVSERLVVTWVSRMPPRPVPVTRLRVRKENKELMILTFDSRWHATFAAPFSDRRTQTCDREESGYFRGPCPREERGRPA